MKNYTALKHYSKTAANLVVILSGLAVVVLVLLWAFLWTFLYGAFPYLHYALSFLALPLLSSIHLLVVCTNRLLYLLTLSYHPHPVELSLTLKEPL